jgi:hypothetical protein
MFTLVRNLRLRDASTTEIPGFTVSLLIAEFFYKFHSFTLECIAFLATWLAVSSVLSLVTRRFLVPKRDPVR